MLAEANGCTCTDETTRTCPVCKPTVDLSNDSQTAVAGLEKVFFVDLETTGVDSRKHGIWQMAFRIIIKGVEVERFKWTMRPFPGKMVAEDALKVGKVTLDELRTFDDPTVIYQRLMDVLKKYCNKFDRQDKLWFVGYNAFFDNEFLRRWFEDNGDRYFGSWFYFPYIDVMQLAAFVLAPVRSQLENFKQQTVMEFLGFPLENAHDAGADIDGTMRMFYHFEKNGLRMRFGTDAIID